MQDLVGPPQLLVLVLQLLDALHLGRGRPITLACIDLWSFDPFQQRLRYATDLRGNLFHCCPTADGYSPTVLLYHAHGALSDFW